MAVRGELRHQQSAVSGSREGRSEDSRRRRGDFSRGGKERPALLGTRKNNRSLTLSLAQDVVDAIRWHIKQGYSGEEFLFSADGTFPRHLDSHKRPLRTVQRALGLRELSHHQIGRHSVASQAATSGHSIKAIQAQLGHQSAQSTHLYAHWATKRSCVWWRLCSQFRHLTSTSGQRGATARIANHATH